MVVSKTHRSNTYPPSLEHTLSASKRSPNLGYSGAVPGAQLSPKATWNLIGIITLENSIIPHMFPKGQDMSIRKPNKELKRFVYAHIHQHKIISELLIEFINMCVYIYIYIF